MNVKLKLKYFKRVVKMGYEYFALLAHDRNEDVDIDQVRIILERNNGKLFGNVFRNSSGFFEDMFYDIKSFVKTFYEQSGIKYLYVYTCEFDGERVTKHIFVNGEWEDKIDIKTITNNPNVKIFPNIASLAVDCNLTVFCNKDYPFDYD